MSPSAQDRERAHALAVSDLALKISGILGGTVGRLLGDYEHRLWLVHFLGELRDAIVMRGASRADVTEALRGCRKLGSISRYLASTAEIEDEPTPVERPRR